MAKHINAYLECKTCKGLLDCPYRDVDINGSPLPPVDCPSYTDRMKQVEQYKKRHDRNINRIP